MALKKEDLDIINSAIQKGGTIKFKYYPNKYPRVSISQERLVLPLKLFRRGGEYYLFAYFLSGGSASGGFGYRLYFQKNIYDVQSTSVSISFSKKSNSKIFMERLLRNNQVE